MGESVEDLVKTTRACSFPLGASSIDQRNKFLEVLAEKLTTRREEIFAANKQDLDNATNGDVSDSLVKRLKLQQEKLDTLITGLKNLIELPDPLTKTTFGRELDQGLNLYRVTCPIGVLCIIFESRPEAVIQISSLAIKSGNCVVLKGGKEADCSNTILVDIIQDSLRDPRVKLPDQSIVLVRTRDEIKRLLTFDKYIDLIIPRGSNSLVTYIQRNTNIPVMGHADGVCHVFFDESAELEKGVDVAVDAKTDYCAACNACETVLVHQKTMEKVLPLLARKMIAKGVTLHCDPTSFGVLKELGDKIKPLYTDASEVETPDKAMEIFKKEYLSLDVSVVVVDGLDSAIMHINTFGSHHTDCILSVDKENIDRFYREVDSAGVYSNCSTRFADGFRYGFGAEVGVSTNKLHARGPVGMEGLLTYKYRLVGNGQIVDDYSSNRKQYSHKDLTF